MKMLIKSALITAFFANKRRVANQAHVDIQRTQNRVLSRILETTKGTDIGEMLGLDSVTNYQDWLCNVHPREYSFYEPFVEKLYQGRTLALFQDELTFVAHTSGDRPVSGMDGKRVPFNTAATEAYMSGIITSMSYVNKQVPSFRPGISAILTYGTASDFPLENTKIQEGYISELMNSALASRGKGGKRIPNADVLGMKDWDERIDAICHSALEEDLLGANGPPLYMVRILERALEISGKSSLSAVWPNFELYFCTGGPVSVYETRIRGLFNRPLKIFGSYFATEGPFGHCQTASSSVITLNIDQFLFSFSDLDSSNTVCLGSHEVELNKSYLLNVGIPNGFIHYCLNDVVRVVSCSPLRVEVLGRKGIAMDMASERLREVDLKRTVASVAQKSGIKINHFFVSPGKNSSGLSAYNWWLSTNDLNVSLDDIASAIDVEMIDSFPEYAYLRVNEGTLGRCVVELLPSTLEEAYFRKHRDEGQLKLRSVFPDRSSVEEMIMRIQQ